jgi:HEAT repeat protein
MMNETRNAVRAAELVGQLADSGKRENAYAALEALGPVALAAVREGLGHANWQVRRWCTIFLDHRADTVSLEVLIPLLRDPKSNVRMWAVHSLSCERCKEGENPIDAVPLLLERIENDESVRVRRMAAAMVAYGRPDGRAVPVFKQLLRQEADTKLRLHASLGLKRCREAGIPGTD